MALVTLAIKSLVNSQNGVPRPLWILSRCRGYRHLHAPLVQWQNGGLQNRIQRFDSSTECQSGHKFLKLLFSDVKSPHKSESKMEAGLAYDLIPIKTKHFSEWGFREDNACGC